MKTLKDLEKEYEEFEVKSKFITNPLEFLAFLEVGIDNAIENQKTCNKEIFLNNLTKMYLKIKSVFLRIIGEEFEESFDQDNEVLEQIISLDDNYIDFFVELSQIATEDNFEELTKLVDFSCEYYSKQIDFYEAERDALEYNLKGFSYINPRCEDNKEVIKEFFQKKINEFIKEKPVEKTKKI